MILESSMIEKVYIYIGLDKSGYQVNIFFYFSPKKYVVGTH